MLSAHFDIYNDVEGGSAEAAAMEAFLVAVPPGDLLVLLVADANDYWDPAIPQFSPALTTVREIC